MSNRRHDSRGGLVLPFPSAGPSGPTRPALTPTGELAIISSAAEPGHEFGNSDDWVQLVRNDFPALAQTVHGRRLIYLDNAATTQKPHQVISALGCAYAKECADLTRGSRGGHALSQLATERFEAVRDKVRRFIAAPSTREVIFTSGTTESINLLAHTLGSLRLAAGDEVVVSGLEHHSNLLPWQLVCAARGARLRVIPLNPVGEVEIGAVASVLGPRTRIVAISHAGNVLGTVVPVAEIAQLAHARGALVAVDGAQAVPHLRIDVNALGCDFYSFSAHKLYGPTGVGVLWGRASLLEQLPPWQSGGATALSVSAEGAVFREIPYKFEAGTPPIAAVIGLGAALDYIQDCGRATIAEHEAFLYAHGVRVLSALTAKYGLRLLGSAAPAVPILSFTVDGVSPAELAAALDLEGIAVQAGHHYAQPLLQHLGLAATVRVSLGCYNTVAELDALAAAIKQIVRRLSSR